MKLWVSLYGFFWLAVVQILLGVLLAAGVSSWGAFPYLHAGIGGVIVGWSFYNFRALRASRAPGRTKRTAAATFGVSLLMVILGLLLWLGVEIGVGSLTGTVNDGIAFAHLILALAIVTQAASTATGFDMWMEREFEQETEPGVIPMIRRS